MLVHDIFYFDMLRSMDLIASAETTKTAMIGYSGGRLQLVYNPSFFHSLKPSQQVGLFEHEILQAASGHIAQRRHELDPVAWNLASDLAVNELIQRDRLPPNAPLADFFDFWPRMNAEFYYPEL